MEQRRVGTWTGIKACGCEDCERVNLWDWVCDCKEVTITEDDKDPEPCDYCTE